MGGAKSKKTLGAKSRTTAKAAGLARKGSKEVVGGKQETEKEKEREKDGRDNKGATTIQNLTKTANAKKTCTAKQGKAQDGPDDRAAARAKQMADLKANAQNAAEMKRANDVNNAAAAAKPHANAYAPKGA